MSRPANADRGLRWSPLALALFATGAALLVGGVGLRSPVPLFLALPLLLAAPAAALSGPRGPPRLTLEREALGSGTDVTVRHRLGSLDGTDLRAVEVAAEPPAGMTEFAPPSESRNREALEIDRHWRTQEPSISVVPVPRVVWRDPLGLVERPAHIEIEPLVVERYPPELLRVGTFRLRHTIALPGEIRSRRIGSVGDFYGLREARPSDPFRRINWRASARAGRLLANEYELDRTGDVLILLDARATSLGRRIDERILSISRGAAAGLAAAFLRTKNRVGLGVFSEFLDAVPLSMGRAQGIRIRSRLLAARRGPEGVPPERAAVSLGRYFPPGTTTILLSSLAEDVTEDLTVYLRRRGYPVVVLSASPLPLFPEERMLSEAEEAIVTRIVRLARRVRIARSWADAPTVDWSDYWSLGEFVDFLHRPEYRRVR